MKIITLHANTKEIIPVYTCYGHIRSKNVTLNAKEHIALHTCNGQKLLLYMQILITGAS